MDLVRIMRLSCVLLVFCLSPLAKAETIRLFDFRQGSHGWAATHAVSDLAVTAEGLEFDCTGEDPYISGPPVTKMPLGTRVLLILRMKSDGDNHGQLFYGSTFRPRRMLDIPVEADGRWHEYELMLPPQRRGTRFRIDPAAMSGHITIAWIDAVELKPLMEMEFPAPGKRAGGDPRLVTSGYVTVAHDGGEWGNFVVRVGDEEMAAGHAQSRIGAIVGGKGAYLNLAGATFDLAMGEDGSLRAEARLTDADGVHWSLSRTFSPVEGKGAVTVETRVAVDRDREVFHLPMLTLFPGLDTFGEDKTQAVLPGVEYLANEPSSSEADVRGDKANRRIVDDYKLTFPMMALAARGRYVGLVWDRKDHPAAVFDSPDRVYDSGAHLMALWYPGVGKHRIENELNVFRAVTIKADEPITLTATLIGGVGRTIVPAVRHYVELAGGLPAIPQVEGGLQSAVELLAHGWLDSALNVDWRWRHAVWQDRFAPAAVADAPGYMLWLAEHSDDPVLSDRLREGARKGLEQLEPGTAFEASCSHVARPFMPLIFGSVENYAERKRQSAWRALDAFGSDGLIRYSQGAGRVDYASTHWEDHANGLSAVSLERILEAAAFTGDERLAREAVAVLDKQLKTYRNTVPRGAQTWEVPLHTPDILASARVLRCCNLAYQLTGRKTYIEAARYWAWTGVPMVYLDPPTAGPKGLYMTTAVLGATNWVAPFWIGQPVQWCGLVYRSALQDLSRIDADQGGFWAHLAKGVTVSGLQQTFPLNDKTRQGLLPDFFHLKQQKSDGPAINPGTLQANLAEAYGCTPVYDLRRVADDGLLLHVPGGIGAVKATDSGIEVAIDGWRTQPYWVRFTRVGEEKPEVHLAGGKVLDANYGSDFQTLDLLLEGDGTLVMKR